MKYLNITSYIFAVSLMSVLSFASHADESTNEVFEHFLNFAQMPGLDLEATSDEKRASLGVGFTYKQSYINFSASGKIDDDEGQFLDRSGLENDSEVAVSITRLFPSKSGLNDESLYGARLEQIKAAKNIYEACQQEATRAGEDVSEYCEMQKAAFDAANKPIIVDDDLNPLRSYQFVKFGIKVNEKTFESFDVNSSTASELKKEGYEAEFSYGKVHSQSAFRWEIGLAYQDGYSFESSNSLKNVCSPISGTTSLQCQNVRLLPPVKIERIVPSVSFGKEFDSEGVLKAAALKVSYLDEDLKKFNGEGKSDSKVLIEIPFYFFSTKDNDFRGGIKFAWASEVPDDQDKLSASVFFGKSFDIFGD